MDRARQRRQDRYAFQRNLLHHLQCCTLCLHSGAGTIGITEYAAKALGDVVYVELPELGMEVTKGDTIGAVESVKSASDIMTPVSGKISDHNKLLEEKPGTINKSPESEGWLAKIEISNLNELDSLMSKEDYDNFEKE